MASDFLTFAWKLLRLCSFNRRVRWVTSDPFIVPLGKVTTLTGHSDGMVRDNHPQVPVYYDVVPLSPDRKHITPSEEPEKDVPNPGEDVPSHEEKQGS